MQYKNTNKEIWRKVPGDYYSPSIHVTENGAIGIEVGGYVIVQEIENWHKQVPEVLDFVSTAKECSIKMSAAFWLWRKLFRKDTKLRLMSYCCKPGCAMALCLSETECDFAIDSKVAKQVEKIRELENVIHTQRRQLEQINIALKHKNLALDALHYVWCDGGCSNGVHRYAKMSEVPLTEDIVRMAEGNTVRLRRWYTNSLYKNKPKPREGITVGSKPIRWLENFLLRIWK